MIQVNWMAITMVVALGALLTALLTYVVATVGRSPDSRTGTNARQGATNARELGHPVAERRPAA